MRTDKKIRWKQLRRWRIRKKVSGTAERPRMSVCFSGRNIHVQFIDDQKGVTLSAASTLSKTTPNRVGCDGDIESAIAIKDCRILSIKLYPFFMSNDHGDPRAVF